MLINPCTKLSIIVPLIFSRESIKKSTLKIRASAITIELSYSCEDCFEDSVRVVSKSEHLVSQLQYALEMFERKRRREREREKVRNCANMTKTCHQKGKEILSDRSKPLAVVVCVCVCVFKYFVCTRAMKRVELKI